MEDILHVITRKRLKRLKAQSSPNPGKRTIYFTIGGTGKKFDNGTVCTSPWNPGKVLPSKAFKK